MKMQLVNFGAGLTDFIQADDGALEYFNWAVRPDASIEVRDGSQRVFVQLPPGNQRISWVGKHEGTYFAVTGRELYSYIGSAWQRITPLGQSVPVFAYGDTNSFVTSAIVGRDLVLCLSPGAGDTGANVPVRVVWDDDRDGSNMGGWTVYPLGLPPVSLSWYYSGLAEDIGQVFESGKSYEDYLWNWGASWCVEFRNRGRVRRVFGPCFFWESSQRLEITFARPDDPFVAAYPNELVLGLWNPEKGFRAGFEPWVNQSVDRYPVSRMKLAVYRSKANSTQLYCVGRLNNDAGLRTQFRSQLSIHGVDSSHVVGDLKLGKPDPVADSLLFAPVPFFDSQVDSEACPPLGFIGDNGTTLFGGGAYDVTWKTGALRVDNGVNDRWYGGWSRLYEPRPERVRQGVPGTIDSWPRSFYVDLDAAVTGVSGLKGTAFAFTAYRTYCLDGGFDQLGNGGLRKRQVGDGVGCSSCASILRFGQSLYWLGDDGFYTSDGVNLNPVSLRLRRALIGRSCFSAHADLAGRRLFWVLDNGVWVCFPDFGVNDSTRCFTKWDGLGLYASCFFGDGNVLYRGGNDGWVSRHDPSFSGDTGIAFEAVYRTAFIAFGDAVADKRQPRVDLVVDNPGSPYSIAMHSFKDGKNTFSTPEMVLVQSGLGTSESAFINSRGVVPVKRYQRSSDLRCHSRSMRVAFRGPCLSKKSVTNDLIYRGVVGGFPSFQFTGGRPAVVISGCLAFLEGNLSPLEISSVGVDTISINATVPFAVGYTLTDWGVFGSLPAGAGMRGLVLHYSGSADDIQGGNAG